MKPEGVGVDAKMDEVGDVEPCEFFVQMGMLVLESRLPMPSVKGRQDGPHCPRSVSDWSNHVCDMSKPQCLRAVQVQKQIQTLWRNHVPLCIEVLLLPDCEHGQQKALSTDVAPPVVEGGYVLLEQWTLQNLAKKSGESLASPRALFQAMRSYLHFSQLSAWLNSTQGTRPSCIGYRVSPPAEFCTTSFNQMPEMHTFPLAAVNKSVNIKVSLAYLSRLPVIPNPVCYELSGKQPCRLQGPSVLKENDLFDVNDGLLRRSNSPRRFDKPNILHSLTVQELEMLSNSPRYVDHGPMFEAPLSHECCNSNHNCHQVNNDAIQQSRFPICKQPTLSSDNFVREMSKETGAIPKRPSLQLHSIPEVCLSKPHLSPQEIKYNQFTSRMSPKSQMEAKFKDLIIHNRPHQQVTASTVFSKISPVHLGASALLKENADSDGSSPDFDLLLNTTLASRCEPLTPEEMADYLYKLCPDSSQRIRPCSLQTSERKLINRATDDYGMTVSEFCETNWPVGRCANKLSEVDISRKNCQKSEIDNSCKLSIPINNDKQKQRENLSSVISKHFCDQSSLEENYRNDEIPSKARNHLALQSENWSVVKSENQSSALPGNQSNVQHGNQSNVQHGNLSNVQHGNQSNVQNGNQSTKRIPKSLDSTADIEINSKKRFNVRPVFTVGPEGDEDVFLPSTTSENSGSKVVQANGRKLSVEIPTTPLSIHKSISCPSKNALKSNGLNKANSLLRTVIMKRELQSQSVTETVHEVDCTVIQSTVPTEQEKLKFKQYAQRSAGLVFHHNTGLPMQSSPVPAKRMSSGSFDYDSSLTSIRAIKNSLSCINLDKQDEDGHQLDSMRRTYSTSAPASTNCLLGNFEESLINGRIDPVGIVEGFTVDIGASGSFCPHHITLPVTAFFFSLSDDNAPSPYLGHINLESYSKRGYHIPNQGTVQVTLFNPNKTVVKMFVVKYDVSDMPANHQTFLRQRTLYMPVRGSPSDVPGVLVYLRYLIHLRFASSKTSKIYLHTDIRIIFARDKFELDSRVANYELRSFTEGPENPRYSPKR